jgi:predicted RNase H-like nuclease (RuvC/YqgF family)
MPEEKQENQQEEKQDESQEEKKADEGQNEGQEEKKQDGVFDQEAVTKLIQERVKGYKSEIAELKGKVEKMPDLETDNATKNERITELEKNVTVLTACSETGVDVKTVEELGITWDDEDDLRGKLKKLKATAPSPMDDLAKKQGGEPKQDLGARLVNFLNSDE